MTLFSPKPAFTFFFLILMSVLNADDEGLVSKLYIVQDTAELKGADKDVFLMICGIEKLDAIEPKEDDFYDLPETFVHDPIWRQMKKKTDEKMQEKSLLKADEMKKFGDVHKIDEMLEDEEGEDVVGETEKYLQKTLDPTTHKKYRTELTTGPYIKERPAKFNQQEGQRRNPFLKNIPHPTDQQCVDIKAKTDKKESHLMNQQDFKVEKGENKAEVCKELDDLPFEEEGEDVVGETEKYLQKTLDPTTHKKYRTELTTGPYIKERPAKLNQQGGQRRNPFLKNMPHPTDQQCVDIKAKTNKKESQLNQQSVDFTAEKGENKAEIYKELDDLLFDEGDEDDSQDFFTDKYLTATNVEETEDKKFCANIREPKKKKFQKRHKLMINKYKNLISQDFQTGKAQKPSQTSSTKSVKASTTDVWTPEIDTKKPDSNKKQKKVSTKKGV